MRQYFGSLYLGVYDYDKQLKFVGSVGTGFTETSLAELYQQLNKLQILSNPFNSRPPGIKTEIWVKPKLIAEVEFSEWTKEGKLRHPSFKGLRLHKKPKEINPSSRFFMA